MIFHIIFVYYIDYQYVNSNIMNAKLYDLLGQIDDPRRDLGKLHPLNDILLIGILSVLSGADSWNEMEDYARAKEEFLKTFLELPHGKKSLIHMLSAWANANNMVLGQVKTDVKSNDITAIPKLLQWKGLKSIIKIESTREFKNNYIETKKQQDIIFQV